MHVITVVCLPCTNLMYVHDALCMSYVDSESPHADAVAAEDVREVHEERAIGEAGAGQGLQ